MHTHSGFLQGLTGFTWVLLLGTAWRLIAAEAVKAGRPTLVREIGANMPVQF